MKCPNCQTVNPETAKFCMNCGTALSVQKNVDGQAEFRVDQFLPNELQQKLESARRQNTMEGERRVITMLFCDVKGSTSAAEKVDPEIWTEIMNGIFEIMIRPVYKYEGMVPRLMGDAILAFFGAPIAHEDDPQRAVLAGLEIQENIKPYAEEIRSKHGLEFGLRVGINTGLVVVGAIGSDLRMEYTAIGDAINLAARMEQTAAPGTVQVSDETYKLISPFFEFESLGDVEVKGKSEPIKTYRPLKVKKTPGQLRGLEGLSSPLVGREDQLAVIKDCVNELANGKGSVVSLVGEAGLGKSTLINEVSRNESRVIWLRGDSLSYTRSVSYHPWRQIIRQSIEAREEDSQAEVRNKLQYVCECCSLPGGDVPFLEAMLAVESEESAKVVMGFQGDALKQRMIDATRGFMCGLAAENPLVFVFDDLHWSDEASLNLLNSVLDLAGAQRIVFICMSRPDTTSPGWELIKQLNTNAGGSYFSLELSPLQSGQTEILLNNLLGVNDLPRSIRDSIAEKGEGNPFFIEEMIRSLMETKQIVQQDGHWVAAGGEAKITLPNTLRGVLSARIDRLAETPKHVLQNAAVIGRSFDLKVLRRLTGLQSSLDPQIQYLEDVSLIEALLEEYAFRHVLIQEATYDSILIKKRAELHRQIGEVLEELYSNRIEEFAPLVANHFYSAGDDRSLKYDLIAGEKSARLYANAEAVTHFNRALDVAKRIKIENDQLESIYVKLGQAYELSGNYDRALDLYKEMQTTSLERQDESMQLKSLIALATIYSTLTPVHDSELGEASLKQALELANKLSDVPVQAKLHWNLMLNYLFSDRLTEALEYCEPTIALSRQAGDPDQLAFALNDAGRVYQGVGMYDQAFKVFDEANDLWKQSGNQVMLADNFGAAAMANYFAGNYDKALSLADQAFEISLKTENHWGQSYSRVVPAYVYLDRGQFDLVDKYAKEGIETGKKGGLLASIVLVPVELAWMNGLYGDIHHGIELAEQAVQVAIDNMSDWKTPALCVLIRLHLMAGNGAAAENIINSEHLSPVMTVIRSRYMTMTGLASIELHLAKKDYPTALSLTHQLLSDISHLGWINKPEILYQKADALIGLGQLNEALQTLSEAGSLAEKLDAKHHLWTIYSSMARVNLELGNKKEAEKNKKQARTVVEFIAERLETIGLRDAFLSQVRVKKLM